MGRGQSFSPPEVLNRTHPKVAGPFPPVTRRRYLVGQAPLKQTQLGVMHPDFLAKAVDLGVDFASNEQEEAGEI